MLTMRAADQAHANGTADAALPEGYDGHAVVTHGRFHHGQVLAGPLRVPPYQRPVRTALVKEIAQNFDPDLLKALVVSRREHQFWIVDGNHRLQAVLALGWHDQNVPCLVYEDLTYAEEVAIFRAQARSAALKPTDFFRADLAAGEAGAVEIKAVCDARGFPINVDTPTDAPHTINAVASVRAVHALGGADLLRETLQVLHDTFGRDHYYTSWEIRGFAAFLRWFPEADRARTVAVARRLGTIGLTEGVLAQRRVSRCDQATGVAATLHAAYNRGLRANQLPIFAPRSRGGTAGDLKRPHRKQEGQA